MSKYLKFLFAAAIFISAHQVNAQNGSRDYYKKTTPDTLKKDNDFSRIRFAVSGGFSTMTASISSTVPSYLTSFVQGLTTGGDFSVEFTYFMNRYSGLGLKYNLYSAGNTAIVNFPSAGGGTVPASVTVTNYYSFIGPEYYSRLFTKSKKGVLIAGVGLGYMDYYSRILLGSADVKQTGGTFGLTYDIAYDYAVSDQFSIGVQLSIVKGTLFEYQEDDGSTVKTVSLAGTGIYESLNHLDFSVGLRYTPVPKIVKGNVHTYM
jgi:hypothetical protein